MEFTGNETKVQLRQYYAVIRGRLKHAHDWIINFNLRNQPIEGVEVRLVTIEQLWIDFLKLDKAFQMHEPSNYDEQERRCIENYYYDAYATARSLIAKHKKSDQNQSTSVSNEIHATHSNSPVNQIELPAIILPTFNGSYDEWPKFRDTFKALIEKHKNLSDIIKLHYLRLVLQEVAAEIVVPIMSADNYEIAWKLLEEQFEIKPEPIHYHLQALIDFPEVKRESHSALCQLLDTTQKHVCELKKLDQLTDQWGIIFVYLLTAKLDSITYSAWENQTSSTGVTIYDQFIEFITNRCIMLNTSQKNLTS